MKDSDANIIRRIQEIELPPEMISNEDDRRRLSELFNRLWSAGIEKDQERAMQLAREGLRWELCCSLRQEGLSWDVCYDLYKTGGDTTRR
jgi:hypothetical protein